MFLSGSSVKQMCCISHCCSVVLQSLYCLPICHNASLSLRQVSCILRRHGLLQQGQGILDNPSARALETPCSQDKESRNVYIGLLRQALSSGYISFTRLHVGVSAYRWERFEELLEEAQTTRDYDVTLAINQMADFLLSDNGAHIRQQLSGQVVDQVDQLGVDALSFARKNVGQVGGGVCIEACGQS